jgi:hypothetical protein
MIFIIGIGVIRWLARNVEALNAFKFRAFVAPEERFRRTGVVAAARENLAAIAVETAAGCPMSLSHAA